jgi:hypothetical protein
MTTPGVVTDFLLGKLARQIDREKIVLWYDPEHAYGGVADTLEDNVQAMPPGTRFARYQDSFFALRYAVEPLIGGLDPPRLLIYLPLEQADTENALVELETLGVVVRPGQQPVARNTRLSVVAREALKDVLGEEAAQEIADQAAEGRLTLSELDALAERTEGLRGVLATIYDGATAPMEIALAFLSRTERDDDIAQRSAQGDMAALLHSQFGFPESKADDVPTLRRQFARFLFLTDLAASLSGPVPAALATVAVATREADRDSCLTLARTFRLRRDLAGSYADLADAVAREINLHGAAKALPATRAETFREVEQELQRRTEQTLLEATTPEALADAGTLALGRQRGFWAEFLPDLQARWALIGVAGRVLAEADRIERGLKALGSAPPPAKLLSHYTEGETPWCLLDTHHRHLERRWHNFDFDGDTDGLEQLGARARQRYSDVAGVLADKFTRGFQRERFRPEATGLALRQVDLFDQRVCPYLKPGEKVAYFLIDALRYEMARELTTALADEASEVVLEAAVGAVPTITEIGMAALMPGAASQDTKLIPGRVEGKVALEIGGKALRGREERVQHLKGYLRTQHNIEAIDVRLEELLPRPPRPLQKAMKQAGFLLVTSQEIDALCESGNVPLARRTMDEMLHQIRRAFRVLSDLGVTRIVCAADHGHLFADELQDDMKIEAPGGETVDLHRRVWIGRGGASDPAYLRAKVSDFNFESSLELATPYNLACFKAPGTSLAYFHGGISPQEIVVPTLSITIRHEIAFRAIWIWNLRPGSARITTRFFSVTVEGTASSMFDAVPPHVRVELRVDGSRVVSAPVSASYGYEESTGDIALQLKADSAAKGLAETQPNTIALMLTEEMASATVSLHLLDAATGVELTRVDALAVALSM